MWAWYAVAYGPPASVRSTVAPGTLSRAAAFTLAAASLERGSRSGRAAFADELDFDGLSAAPASAAPPSASAASAARAAADLRIVVSVTCSSVGWLRRHRPSLTCESAEAFLGRR